jgi:hypothetical protein
MIAVHGVARKGVDLVLVTVLAVGRIAVCRNDLLNSGTVLGADRRVGADVTRSVMAGDAGADTVLGAVQVVLIDDGTPCQEIVAGRLLRVIVGVTIAAERAGFLGAVAGTGSSVDDYRASGTTLGMISRGAVSMRFKT